MAFVFYDTETSGIQTSFDQVLQFAAIKTDADLNIIDKIDIRSRLQPHVIPSPHALRVTGMTIERLLDPETPSHYSMVAQVRQKLLDWSPSVFLGYNSMKFDEVLLRQAFYQSLYPPYLTQTGGNSRTDVFFLVQSAVQLFPDLFKVPLNQKGKPSFKLDQLAPANGFAHDNAHDALADVEATIHLCRMIRAHAPHLWERVIDHSSKQSVVNFIGNNNPLILTEFRYNVAYNYPVACIGAGEGLATNQLCILLTIDPEDYRYKTDAELASFVSKSPKPLRTVKTNAAPSLFRLDDVPSQFLGDLSIEEVTRRGRVLFDDPDLLQRIHAAHAANKPEYETSEHFEEQIYDGFASHDDAVLMDQFHAASWENRAGITEAFTDDKYRFFGRRLIYFERPELLSDAHCAEIKEHITHRMDEGGKWTSLSKAMSDTEKLLETAEGVEAALLDSYHGYLSQQIKPTSVAH